MPYLNEDNWLTVEERRTTRVPNEDGNPPDDEASVDYQIRMERTDAGYTIPSASALPGAQIRDGRYNKPTGVPDINFSNLRTPSRPPKSTSGPSIQSQTATSGLSFQPPMSSLAGLTTTSSNPTLPTQEEILMHYSEMVAKQLDKQLNPQKGAPAGDEDLSGPSDDEDGPDEPDEPTESSSASDEGSDSMYRSQRTLSNRPPGAPKDSGIDITTLKARKRQANTRRVTATRYTKKNNT